MGNPSLRKLSFSEINHRWIEIKGLSATALNNGSPNDLQHNFEIAMARFLLLCQTDVAQVWISSENDKECYLCLSFIGASVMTQEKGFTFYSVVKFKDCKVEDKQKHWLFFLNKIYEFAKSKNCKRIGLEADFDYWHKLFKKTPLPYKYETRNSLRVYL